MNDFTQGGSDMDVIYLSRFLHAALIAQAGSKLRGETFDVEKYAKNYSKQHPDEAPSAYKPIKEIIAAIEPTAEVVDVLKPIYNFKAH